MSPNWSLRIAGQTEVCRIPEAEMRSRTDDSCRRRLWGVEATSRRLTQRRSRVAACVAACGLVALMGACEQPPRRASSADPAASELSSEARTAGVAQPARTLAPTEPRAEEDPSACARTYERSSDADAVERRLVRELRNVTGRAGLRSLGGDDPYFDATQTLQLDTGAYVDVHLYPTERSCVAGTMNARRRDTENGVRVVYGRLDDDHASRFRCAGMQYDVTATRRGAVRAATKALTGSLPNACRSGS